MSESEKELNDLEQALARLVPVEAKIERDRLFYAVGRASLKRRQRLLVALSVLLAGTTFYLGYLVVTHPGPQVVVRTVTVTVPAPAIIPSTTPAVPVLPPSVEPEPEDVTPLTPPVVRPGGYDEDRSPYPSYGRIQKGIPNLGEYALPPLSAPRPSSPYVGEPTRLGSRPNLFDYLFGDKSRR